MSTLRMNRLPKGDGKPLTGYRSMFDFVTVGSSVMAAPTLPKTPLAPVVESDEERDEDQLADGIEFADSSDEDGAVDKGANEKAAKRQRKSYSGKEKQKALQLVAALGVNNASRKLKVAPGTLSGWKVKLGNARKKRLLEAPANTPGLPVTLEDEIGMLADARSGNGKRVPPAVEQAMHTWFMHMRQKVYRSL